jgi:hypothetical protein
MIKLHMPQWRATKELSYAAAPCCVLPAALLALLHDERTSAASENSVLAAVQSWLAAQPPGTVNVPQRQQLASAVRLPLLEPTYLATVLPRMQWLLEILGPHGLAAAAGAARGMFDPHAEPCLSNPRACGVSEDWLRGPRPLPASCSGDEERGPGVSIEWSLPLSKVSCCGTNCSVWPPSRPHVWC